MPSAKSAALTLRVRKNKIQEKPSSYRKEEAKEILASYEPEQENAPEAEKPNIIVTDAWHRFHSQAPLGKKEARGFPA